MSERLKVAILLETCRVIDRQLLRGIGQYSKLHGPWAIHIVSEGLEELKPSASFWDSSGVIMRLSSKRLANAVTAARIPAVVVDSFCNPIARRMKHRIADVFVDSYGVARLAVEYFSSRGFEQFAFVGVANRHWSTLRCNSFSDVIGSTGHPLHVYPPNDSTEKASTLNALADWLAQLPKPIALLACDDARGRQVLEACRLARIYVPNEVAVIGVGNDELLCETAEPPLSSISLNAIHGGYQAAHALDRMIREPNQLPQQLIVEPMSVVVRSSTDFDVSHDPVVSAALRIIRCEFTQDLAINSVAKSVGLSRRALEAKFRKYLGKTMREEIQDLRLARAKTILKETQLPVAEVAMLTGYQSASHMVQLFAREVGLTPAKFRIASRLNGEREAIWAIGSSDASKA